MPSFANNLVLITSQRIYWFLFLFFCAILGSMVIPVQIVHIKAMDDSHPNGSRPSNRLDNFVRRKQLPKTSSVCRMTKHQAAFFRIPPASSLYMLALMHFFFLFNHTSYCQKKHRQRFPFHREPRRFGTNHLQCTFCCRYELHLVQEFG